MLFSRVAVVIPGSEGEEIVRAFRSAGVMAQLCEACSDVPSDALVVASVHAGLLPVLRVVGAERLLALDWQPLAPDEKASLLGFCMRPADANWVVACALPHVRRQGEVLSSEPFDGDDAGVKREPTMMLDSGSTNHSQILPEFDDGDDLQQSNPEPTDDAALLRGRDVEVTSSHDLSGHKVARFSPSFEDLLRRADRRLFPMRAALALEFPGGDEHAHLLVPDEFIHEQTPAFIAEPDPLEAFTFVGGVEAAMNAESDPPAKSSSPPTAPTLSTVAGVRPKASVRRPLDLFELLSYLAEAPSSTFALSCELMDGTVLRLLVDQGRLVELNGPVFVTALGLLGRTGSTDEETAQQWLDEAVKQGRISVFAGRQIIRRSYENLVHRIVSDFRTAVMEEMAAPHSSHSLLRGTLLQRIVDGAKLRVSPEQLPKGLQASPFSRFRLADRHDDWLALFGLDSEIEAEIRARDGETLASLLQSAPPSVGMAGVLWLLVQTSFAQVHPEDHVVDVPRSAITLWLQEEVQRVSNADYFAVLDVDRGASDVEVEEAHERMQHTLVALSSDPDLRDFASDLEVIQLAIEDAHLMLGNAKRRSRYRSALGDSNRTPTAARE